MRAADYRSPAVRKAWDDEAKRRTEVIRACKDVKPVVTYDDAWRGQAECRGADPTLFYPGERPNGRPKGWRPVDYETDDLQQARQTCLSCPVRGECLGDALTYRERFGVRAGLTPAERRPFAQTWETFICRRCSIIFDGGPSERGRIRNYCDACRIEVVVATKAESRLRCTA